MSILARAARGNLNSDIPAGEDHRNNTWSGNRHGIDLAGDDSRLRSARLDQYQFDIDSLGVEGRVCGHPNRCHSADGRNISNPKLVELVCRDSGNCRTQNRQFKDRRRKLFLRLAVCISQLRFLSLSSACSTAILPKVIPPSKVRPAW